MTIHIENLTTQAIIGILDFEREKAQNIIIDLKLNYEYDKNSFLNYADIAQTIINDMQIKKYGLLEDALESLKEILFSQYPNIKTLYIKLTKPDILKNCHVGLSKTWNF